MRTPEERCPRCHQVMRNVRFGVPMTPIKARIVDAVRSYPGISSGELAERVNATHNVRNHISQINDMLAATDWRIVGRARQGYHLMRVDPRDCRV